MVFAIGIGGQSASHALKMQTVRQVGIKRVPTVQSRSKRTQYRVARAMAFQGASTSDATPITSTSLTLTVSLPLQVAFGEHLRLVGAHEKLGAWEVGAAPELQWNEGNVWSITLDLPVGFTSEYKLVHIVPGCDPIWEYTNTRELTIPTSATATATATLNLAWCDTTFVETTLPLVGETTTKEILAKKTSTAPIKTPVVPEAIMSSVTSFFNGTSAAAAPTEEVVVKKVAALEAAFVADAAVKEAEEKVEEVLTPAAEPAVPAVAAVTEAILTAGEPATIEVESVAPALVETESESSKMFKSAAKTAGAVALGVAGAAMLSALAVDVSETAIIGAMAVAAGSAALNSSGSKTKKSTSGSSEDGDEIEGGIAVEEDEERKITGAGETGVIIAAGLLTAFDVTKAAVDSVGKKSDDADEE